jgi:hypothetical protein
MSKQILFLTLLIFNLSLVRCDGDDDKKPAVPSDPAACASKVPFSYISIKQPMNSPIRIDEKLEKICPNYKRICCLPEEMATGNDSFLKFIGALKSLEAVVIRLIDYFENINLNKLSTELDLAQKSFGPECAVVREAQDNYPRSIMAIKNLLKNKATAVQSFQQYIKEQQQYYAGFFCMICRTNLQDIVGTTSDGRMTLKIQNDVCVTKFTELDKIETIIKFSNAASILARGVSCANKQDLGYLKTVNPSNKVSQMLGYIKQCMKAEFGSNKSDKHCEADCHNLTKVTTFNLFPHMYYFPDLSFKVLSKYYPPIKLKDRPLWEPPKIEEIAITPADDFVVYPVTGSQAGSLETYEPMFKGDGINLYTIPTNFEKIVQLTRPEQKKDSSFTIDWESPIVWAIIGGSVVLIIAIIVISILCCGKKKKTK